MSAENIRYGRHLLRSWSQDQTVIAMSSWEGRLCAACMAAQQATGTENMPESWAYILTPWNCKWDANAAIGIIGWQGLGNLRHQDPSYLWLQSAVRGKLVSLKKVQSDSNMADLGTKVLEKDDTDRRMKNLGCVRFDR